jgi:hypothetical protein
LVVGRSIHEATRFSASYSKESVMRGLVSAITATAVASSTPLFAEEELYGTYKLLSITQRYLDTGEITILTRDKGFITYGADGRMMVIIVGDDRPKPQSVEKMADHERVGLYRSLVAYGGTYKFDGKTMEHQVDISWNEMWTGTTQFRDVKRDGERLSISTRPAPNARDGRMAVTTLAWEKVK